MFSDGNNPHERTLNSGPPRCLVRRRISTYLAKRPVLSGALPAPALLERELPHDQHLSLIVISPGSSECGTVWWVHAACLAC
jgi:hypothetical protein